MIATYLDSSALVRLCAGEGDLHDVEEAMTGLPITSVLAAVELPIAIDARFHRGQISAGESDELHDTAAEILMSVGKIGLSAAARRGPLSQSGTIVSAARQQYQAATVR